MKRWQVQEAKARFSELMRCVAEQGPQSITVHGSPQAVILSCDEYNKLVKSSGSLVKFLQKSPLADVELDIQRDKSVDRDIDL